jgi:ribose transport system permease protein
MQQAARWLRRNQVTFFVFVLAVVLFILKTVLQGNGFSAFAATSSVDSSLAVGIAAMGETLVILVGGFDLSVGGIISLLNVVLATHMSSSPQGQAAAVGLALGLACALGFVNGALVVWLRLQPIIATLATSFVWSGCALLVLNQPGGNVSLGFVTLLTGDAFGVVPSALAVALVAIGVWVVIVRHRFGSRIYAIGNDQGAAEANGVPVRSTLLVTYTLAGLFYGLGTVFLTAQTAGGDPNIGAPLLLSVFAAVVVGGVAFGGGQGSAIGSLLGGFVLELIGEVLFALGVASFYTDIFQGLVLLAAVVTMALGSRSRRRRGRTRMPTVPTPAAPKEV